MTAVTVIAKYVNMPKDGKKYGNIKTPNNEMFFGLPDQLRNITRGAEVEIDYDTQTWGDRDSKVIKSINVKSSAPPAAGGRNGGNHDGAPWQVPNFVSNVVGQAITAGLIKSPNDIKSWTAAAMMAGKEVLSPIERTQPAPSQQRQATAAGYGEEPPPYDPRDYR